LFDSLYLSIKTDKNVYHYGQEVRLTGASELNLTKIEESNAPTFLAAKDDADTVKGGSLVEIRTNAYDVDRDLVKLFVCDSLGATSEGCAGKLLCTDIAMVNTGCSFEAAMDNELHKWYAYIFDENGNSALSNPISGEYISDVVAPRLEILSFAGDLQYLDNQDDGKLLVTLKGEPGMKARAGKDNEFRFHKDLSYSLLTNECAISGEFANCNLGNIPENDISREQLSNRTMAYFSAVDNYGNEQSNSQNVDANFLVRFSRTPIAIDTYDGSLLMPGSTISIIGSTLYCKDKAGTCSPSIPILNSTVQFNETAHLRYFAGIAVKDGYDLFNNFTF
jgi:hypothetical protein